MLTLMQKYTN